MDSEQKSLLFPDEQGVQENLSKEKANSVTSVDGNAAFTILILMRYSFGSDNSALARSNEKWTSFSWIAVRFAVLDLLNPCYPRPRAQAAWLEITGSIGTSPVGRLGQNLVCINVGFQKAGQIVARALHQQRASSGGDDVSEIYPSMCRRQDVA